MDYVVPLTVPTNIPSALVVGGLLADRVCLADTPIWLLHPIEAAIDDSGGNGFVGSCPFGTQRCRQQ